MSVDPSVVSTILVADVQLWSLPGVQISRDCGLGLGSGGLRSWSWKHSRVLVVRKWSLPRPLRVTRRVGGRPEAKVAGDGHDDGHWRRSQADVKWASWIQRSEPRRRPGCRRSRSRQWRRKWPGPLDWAPIAIFVILIIFVNNFIASTLPWIQTSCFG